MGLLVIKLGLSLRIYLRKAPEGQMTSQLRGLFYKMLLSIEGTDAGETYTFFQFASTNK